MGLPKALRAHASKDLEAAMREYQRAFEQNVKDTRLYQNYGSLLSKYGKRDEAEQVYSQGLKLYPHSHSILQNYANFHRKSKPATAVSCYLKCISLICNDEQIFSQKLFVQLCTDIVETLSSLGLQAWAYSILVEVIKTTGINVSAIKNLVLIADSLFDKSDFIDGFDLDGYLLSPVLSNDCSIVDRISLYFAFAFHYYTLELLDISLNYYNKGMLEFDQSKHLIPFEDQSDARKLINENSWNFSCLKLQLGDFYGWSLFDHGLLASAIGKQRWQRALVKPFTDSEIPIWRGEDLNGKRILFLEEQAVGDAMMFFTLLPDLMKTCDFVGIYVSKRLVSVYKRTFESFIKSQRFGVFSKPDIISGDLLPYKFNFQSAIGSSCQYLYDSFKGFDRPIFKLKVSQKNHQKFRLKYSKIAENNSCRPFLVGISWRGGGRADRIKQKSLEISDFERILTAFPNIQFVSLQYGDVSAQCETWRRSGINIIYDESVNALKDLDLWLAQVEACDAVLSVANTTIHGAGGLHKPTLCLLSQHSDWRWFKDPAVTRSYWYPTVGIERQSSNGSWSQAIQAAASWISSSCPKPEGSQFI